MTLDGFSTGPNDEMDYLPSFNDENMWKDLHEEMWKNLDLADTVSWDEKLIKYGRNIGPQRQKTLRALKATKNFHGMRMKPEKLSFQVR